MNYLSTFPSEELEAELRRRHNEKLYAWRKANVARHSKISSAIVDFLAPLHGAVNCSMTENAESLLGSGYPKCIRCALISMGNEPARFDTIRTDVTVDFTTEKQTSFK